MHEFLTFTIIGVVTGAAYAVASSGLVVTYATSGVFNIAHGAIGMLMAFVYWQLVVPWHVPQAAALVLVVGVFAPILGALVEVLLIRRTRGNTLAVVLVVTVGLMVLLIGVADYIWGQSEAVAPVFFGGHGFHLDGIAVTWQEAITVLVGVAIAAGLRLLLYRTRLGVAMRAVVDNRDLAALNGARPAWIGTVSWSLGAALAALAGILIAPTLQLNVLNLTLLVLDAYAAAIIGRLRNLPATFAGAIGLGLIGSYLVGYLPTSGFWGSTPMQGLHIAYPVLALFVVLLVLPSDTIERGRATLRRAATQVPSLAASIVGGVVMVGVVVAATSFLQSGDVLRLGLGLGTGLVMLSLVPLTGWAGPVSLCQMTFAGLGAFAMARLGHGGDVLGLAAAVALAGAVGIVVALPALRLRGLYLALATMAFATLMDNMVFPSSAIFTFDGSVAVPRPSLFGLHISGNQAYVVFLAVVFALLSVALLALRRGPFGRLLGAVKDSEAACATLGLNLTTTKLAVFALSAGLAGLAGALFGGMQTTAGATDFEMLQSLPVLLLVVLYGVTTTSGAFVGGLSLGVIYIVEAHVPSLSSLQYIATGFAGVTLGFYPDGIVPGVAARLRAWWASLSLAAAGDFPPPAAAALSGAGGPVVHLADRVPHEPAAAAPLSTTSAPGRPPGPAPDPTAAPRVPPTRTVDVGTNGTADVGTNGTADVGTNGTADVGTNGAVDTGTNGTADVGTNGAVDSAPTGTVGSGPTRALDGDPTRAPFGVLRPRHHRGGAGRGAEGGDGQRPGAAVR